MQSLINDPGVAKYRQYEIEEAAKIAEELLRDNPDLAFVGGAMFMLKKLLQLPYKWGKGKESEEAARNMVRRDVKEFTLKYMKLFLE